MIHPFLRLVATKPHLLADHAEAYAGLFGDEVGRMVAALKQRAVMMSVAIGLAGLAAVFGGIALMLWGVVPLTTMPAPWTLIAVPGVPALIALVCFFVGKQTPTEPFADLKKQVAADLLMLREVGST